MANKPPAVRPRSLPELKKSGRRELTHGVNYTRIMNTDSLFIIVAVKGIDIIELLFVVQEY